MLRKVAEEKPTLEKIGTINVDSSTLLLGEPSYLITEDGKKPPLSFREFWDKFTTLQTQYCDTNDALVTHHESVLLRGKKNKTKAVGVKLAKDGNFPVYVERNRGGKVVKIIVDMTK